MSLLIAILNQIDIKEKINNVPNSNYEIGVFIGSMLPFATLVLIAYVIFRHNKKRIDKK